MSDSGLELGWASLGLVAVGDTGGFQDHFLILWFTKNTLPVFGSTSSSQSSARTTALAPLPRGATSCGLARPTPATFPPSRLALRPFTMPVGGLPSDTAFVGELLSLAGEPTGVDRPRPLPITLGTGDDGRGDCGLDDTGVGVSAADPPVPEFMRTASTVPCCIPAFAAPFAWSPGAGEDMLCEASRTGRAIFTARAAQFPSPDDLLPTIRSGQTDGPSFTGTSTHMNRS